MKHFRFTVHTEHLLSIDDIWPDGDAPENPTEEDARDAFRASDSNQARAAVDWHLLEGLYVEIDEVKGYV